MRNRSGMIKKKVKKKVEKKDKNKPLRGKGTYCPICGCYNVNYPCWDCGYEKEAGN